MTEIRSSYKPEDVNILLKDITGLVTPLDTEEREKLIQQGKHYSEMLPIEYRPSAEYMSAYKEALKTFGKKTADATAVVAEKIYAKKGKSVGLVSLARAGIPIGILIKRYLDRKYELNVPHYAISIIRDKGIDTNAMNHILKSVRGNDIQFVDGWTGKGAITKQLQEALKDYPSVSNELAVVADPANLTELCGTHEDILIPSSCLNSTISGLISRTFYDSELIGENDYHGAVYYGELSNEDLSNSYLDTIESMFDYSTVASDTTPCGTTGMDEVKEIQQEYNISDINFIKPGIGETTRVLLRRVPWRVIIDRQAKASSSDELVFIEKLAQEKRIPIEYKDLQHYKAIGIIKHMADI